MTVAQRGHPIGFQLEIIPCCVTQVTTYDSASRRSLIIFAIRFLDQESGRTFEKFRPCQVASIEVPTGRKERHLPYTKQLWCHDRHCKPNYLTRPGIADCDRLRTVSAFSHVHICVFMHTIARIRVAQTRHSFENHTRSGTGIRANTLLMDVRPSRCSLRMQLDTDSQIVGAFHVKQRLITWITAADAADQFKAIPREDIHASNRGCPRTIQKSPPGEHRVIGANPV